MSVAGKRVLVTGADGFIGSHVVERLVVEGARVRAFVQYNSFDSWGWLDESTEAVRKAIEVIPGDIRDPYGVREAVQGCDIVLHLAALIAIPYSYRSPDSYVDTNVRGTLNVVQAARMVGVERVIHTSTSEVYGTARFVPITEDHPLQGQSPYSASKIGADQIALSFFASFGTPVAVLRPFNTYGPRQSARAVIPTIITQLLSGQGRVRLGALAPTRDFSYVSDTVAGFLAAAQCPSVCGQVINLGSNFEVSVETTARLIAEELNVANLTFETESTRVRPAGSEVERLWADNSLAATVLGWRPEYAGLEGLRRGLAKTIVWFRDNDRFLRYRPGTYVL